MKKIALLLLTVFLLTACGGASYKIGQVVDLSAKVSRKTYEHPIDPPTGYLYAAYVRLDGEETVLYSKESIKCKMSETVKFNARVREAKAVPDKATEEVKELHFVVKEFECMGDAIERVHTDGSKSMKIVDIFKDTVVYGTDLGDLDPYKEDCLLRTGVFNECGSPCAPDVEVCIESCVYTCDL